MAKYSDKQLKDMALVVVDDLNRGGMQAIMLIMTVAQRTGIPPQDVANRIQHYANMEVADAT